MSTETTAAAAEFTGIKDGDEVRFSYTMKNGRTGQVRGTAAGFIGKSGRIEGIRVHLDGRHTDAAILASANAANGPVGFAPGRIAGLTVTRTAPRPAARPGYATDAQVRYALSLCERTGNVCRPGEAGFRAMTKAQISEWIDMAKDEI